MRILMWQWMLCITCWLGQMQSLHAQTVLRLSTTTSTDNSGLLKAIIPQFEKETGIKVHVIAAGSGKALELGKNGDVDAVLVHAREAEEQFVAAGFGVDRRDVMHNDFVLVGPVPDPAGIKKEGDLLAALKRLIDSKARFISRGDRSGTELMELSYWKRLGQKPGTPQYVSAGSGMGEVLMMAAEMQAYTLSDRATYLAYQAKSGLQIVFEGDTRMRNPYGVMAVNPARFPDIHYKEAKAWIDWLVSERGRAAIAGFKIGGAQVFFPNEVGVRN